MKSIIQSSDYCYVCAEVYKKFTFTDTEEHHIFFGVKNKTLSEQDGLKVYLCQEHHRTGPEAVHKNHMTDMYLKVVAQAKYEETHTREEFMERYGKSYL